MTDTTNDEQRRTAPCLPPELRVILPKTVAVRFEVTVDVPRIDGEAPADTNARASLALTAALDERAKLRDAVEALLNAHDTHDDVEESYARGALRDLLTHWGVAKPPRKEKSS